MMDYGLEQEVEISSKNEKIEETKVDLKNEIEKENPKSEHKNKKSKSLLFTLLGCLAFILAIAYVAKEGKSEGEYLNNQLLQANKTLVYETLKLREKDSLDNLQKKFYDYSMKKGIDVNLKLSSSDLLGLEFNSMEDKQAINVSIEFNKYNNVGIYYYTFKYYNLSKDMADQIEAQMKGDNYPSYSINTSVTSSENTQLKNSYNVTVYVKKTIEKIIDPIQNNFNIEDLIFKSKMDDFEKLLEEKKIIDRNSKSSIFPQIPPNVVGLPVLPMAPLPIPPSVMPPSLNNQLNNTNKLKEEQIIETIDKDGRIIRQIRKK